METAGIALVAQGAANYFGDLKNATRATDSFVDGTVKGSGKVDAAAGGMSKAFSLVGPAIAGGAALAITAVAGIAAAAFGTASDVNQAANDMQASLGVTAEEAARLGDMALDVWGGNWGSSIKDVSDSIITVRQQMKGLADNELQGVAQKALAVRDSFGVDIAESTNAANTLMQNFGITSDQAFDFITKGMQSGLNASGDFLDTIGEYSTQFSNGGADAGMFFSLLETGLQGGMLGTDRAADAFKEFRVRIQDGSKTTSEGLKALGIDSDLLAAQMASGQVTAADAFQLVQDKLRGTTDANVRMQAGVALIGTQFEDLGTDAALALSMTGTGLADMAGATDKLNKKYDNWPSMWEGIKRSALVALEPLGGKLLDLSNDVMPVVQKGFDWLKNDLPPIITSVTAAIDSGVGFITDLFQNDLTPALESNAAFFDSTFTSVKNIVTDAGKIIQIVLGATSSFISDHGETIQRIVDNTWSSIQAVIDIALALIEGVVKTTLALIQGDWSGAWTAITDMSARVVTGLWTIISGGLDNILALVQDLTGSVQKSWGVMINDALTAGSQFVAGIKEGISSAWGSFTGWVHSKVMELPAAVRTALGIKSPSQVFAEIGQQTIQGWQTGWQTGIPAALNAVKTGALSIASEFEDTDLADILAGIGEDVMAGFGKGLKAGLKGVLSIVNSSANTVEEAFNNAYKTESPSERTDPIGQDVMLGFLQGMAARLPELTAFVSTMSDDLIGQVKDVGEQINGLIADSFGATASIDRQVAANLGKMKDVLPQDRNNYQDQLNRAQKEAEAFADPAEGAKYFQMRSKQIFETAKLEKDAADERQAIADAEQASADATAKQIEEIAKSDELRAQLAIAATDAERDAILRKLEASQKAQDAAIAARHEAEAARKEALAMIPILEQQLLLINAAHQAELKQFDAKKAANGNPLQDLIDQFNQLFNNDKKAALEEQYAKAKTDAERERLRKEIEAAALPVNDTGLGHDLKVLINKLAALWGVPGLARGGLARKGQPHWVGEDGPEIFWPGITGMVSPAASSAQTAARSNTTNYYGNVGPQVQMPIYTNQSPAAIQQSWAIVQASMP